jgi:hypothetical protein
MQLYTHMHTYIHIQLYSSNVQLHIHSQPVVHALAVKHSLYLQKQNRNTKNKR